MAYYCVFGGAGFFTAPTLGNLITASKVRVTAKKMAMPSAGGFLFSQSGAGAAREFGILINSGELRYIYGSSTERVIFTSGEMVLTFGPAPYKCDLLDIIFDTADNTVKVFVNGSASPAKTVALVKGASRIDGMLFRVGARCDSDSAASVGGGFITPNLTWVGDLQIYINEVLVRDYVIPGSGTTIPDLAGGNTLTQRGTWPTDDSEWVFYGAGGATTAAAAFSMPQMSVASSGSAIAPSVTVSSAFAMPQFTVDASGFASVPTFTASASVTMPQMSAVISGSVVISGNAASLSFAMPQMAVAGAATDTAPSFAASIVATMPQMQVQCQALSLASGVIASINMAMPQMSVAALGSDTSPAISASASFTMPQFSVYAVSGGFSFYESDGAHIETIAASSHLEYTYQSTHIEWRA